MIISNLLKRKGKKKKTQQQPHNTLQSYITFPHPTPSNTFFLSVFSALLSCEWSASRYLEIGTKPLYFDETYNQQLKVIIMFDTKSQINNLGIDFALHNNFWIFIFMWCVSFIVISTPPSLPFTIFLCLSLVPLEITYLPCFPTINYFSIHLNRVFGFSPGLSK